MKRLFTFVEERFGLGALLRATFDEQIEGGPRWGHTFANAVLVLFIVQCVTGAFLMLTYVPHTEGAWASVFYIQYRVTNGWLLRGLHSWGGQAMLLVLGLHLVQVAWWGSHKKPREGYWIVLLIVLQVVLLAVISGLRLPWDQQSYWALWVELNIAQGVPVVGEPLSEVIAGGQTLGQSTLTRVYAIHTVILPLVIAKLIILGVWLRRRHGRGAPVWVAEGGASARAFPTQWARDLVLVAVVLVAVIAVTSMFGGGARLEAPADPTRDYPARPEWFILPLFTLRKLLPASMELVATVILPGLVVGGLFALPFLDRGKGKGAIARLVWVVPLALIGAALGGLAQISYAADAADDDFVEARAAADERAARAIELAGNGVPPGGPLAMLNADPMTRGREVYEQYCASCHVLGGEGEQKAPDHTGYGSREWLLALVTNPGDSHFFGETELEEQMPSQIRLGDEALRGAAKLLFSLGREEQDPGEIDDDLVERGRATMESKCMNCHVFGDDGDFLGLGAPNLTGWGSRTWIYRQIAHPDSATQYGELNDMPAFDDQLSAHDLRIVTSYLRRQRFAEPDFEVEPPTEE